MKRNSSIKRLESNNLIERLFVDYLRVSRWFKYHLTTKVKKEKQIYDGKDLHILWHDILGPYYVGPVKKGIEISPRSMIGSKDTILLRDVELSDFVPRAPGLFYSTGYKTWKRSRDKRIFTQFLSPFEPQFERELSQRVPIDLRMAKETAMQFNALEKQPHSISLAKGKGGRIVWAFRWEKSGRVITTDVDAISGEIVSRFDSALINREFLQSMEADDLVVRSGARGVVRFKEHDGVVLLSAHRPSTVYLKEEHTLYRMPVELGFPVIVTSKAYDKIKDEVLRYGQVHVEKVKGTIEQIPEAFLRPEPRKPLMQWGQGIPQFCLRVDSPSLIRNPGTPGLGYACAWSACRYKQGAFFLWNSFKLGTEDYEDQIKESTVRISCQLNTLDSSPLFDFDETRPRFSDAVYGPNYFLRMAFQQDKQEAQISSLTDYGPKRLFLRTEEEKFLSAQGFISRYLEIGCEKDSEETRKALIERFENARLPHERLMVAFLRLLQAISVTFQIPLHGTKEYSGIDIAKKIRGSVVLGFQIKCMYDNISEDKIRAEISKALEYNINGFVLVYACRPSKKVESSIQAAWHHFTRINRERRMYCSVCPPELLAELFRRYGVNV